MLSKAPINTLSKGQKHRHCPKSCTDTHITFCCCGQQHKPKHCPAYGQNCTSGKKPNHFARMCNTINLSVHKSQKRADMDIQGKFMWLKSQSKTYSHITSSSNDSYTLGMDPLRIDGIEKLIQWLSTVKTQSGKFTFKLDTGADANAFQRNDVHFHWDS